MSSQTDYLFSEVFSLGPICPYKNKFPVSMIWICQSSPSPPPPNHHHSPPPGVRCREGVEDGWHLWLVSSIIVKNLDTIGFTACVKDLQPFDQHHDPITVHYIAFGGKEIKDKLIYDRISLLSSKKGALSVHWSPLLSSSLSSFYY